MLLNKISETILIIYLNKMIPVLKNPVKNVRKILDATPRLHAISYSLASTPNCGIRLKIAKIK
jgi:hypothetical protein